MGMHEMSKKLGGRLTASFVVASAMSAAVNAADLVVAAGDSQTISANATYDTITVDGSLTIDSAATVNATMVYVGHDGANGLVTVTGGATLTVPTTTDQGVFLGSITAGSSNAAGRGRLVMVNGNVNGNVYASRNCISNGTTKATSPTNEVWLGEGSVFTGNVHHYADPSLRLAYAGGRQVCVGANLLHVYDHSDTFVDSVDGNPIRIDFNGNHITYPNAGQSWSTTQPFQPNTCVYFRGAGDFLREGLPNGLIYPLHLGGYGTAKMEDWTAFTGRIVADGGGIRFFLANQVDSADADHPREWVARNGGFISFDYVSHNLGSFTGGGFLTNHADSVGTLNVHVAGTETWDVRTPLVKFRKYKDGSLTVKGPVPRSIDVFGGTFTLAGRESNYWTHYRFKVDRVLTNSWGDATVQISEFKLLDGDTDVTTPYAEITSGGSVNSGEGAIKAVDGSVDTKWCYNSSTNNYWIVLRYSNPLRVTRYQWYSANDAIISKDGNGVPTKTWREPIDWRVQGSLDGVTWYDLDVQTDFSPTPLRKALSADFTLGDDTGLIDDLPGNVPVPVTVSTGATYAVGANRDAKFSPLINLGTISYGPGSDLVCGSEGKRDDYLNPMYAGTGDFVKEGSATSFVYGVSALTGAVRVTSGTLALTGFGCPLKYWRFTAKNIETGLDGLFQLGEIDLRAADGTRVNANLLFAASTVEDATALNAGSAAIVQNHGYRSNDTEGVVNLFDGNWSTKCCVVWKDSQQSTRIQPKINDSNSWVIIVFRLAENAKMPVAYHLVSGNDAVGKRNPNYWSLEASVDGVNWITVDEKAGATTPMANSAIFNGGAPYAITNYTGTAAAHFPNASDVIVSPGATLLLAPAGSTLSSLTIDCTGGSGTVNGFTPAAGGTLNLVNAASYREVRRMEALPITLENPGDMSALSTWAVTVNGEPVADKVRFSQGALTLKVRGMSIKIK